MKKIVYSFAVLFISLSSLMAQTIPNASFETWTNRGSYQTPDGWGTMNNLTALASVYTAVQATPGTTGSSYLSLTSKLVGSTVVNGIAVSGKLDTLTMTPVSGFPCVGRPTNLTGKWQHMIYGSSQGSIVVSFTRWDATTKARISVGSGSVTLSGMAMSWASFSVPISYTDSNNPDSCIIVLKASGSNPTARDYLWVDNLAFIGSPTGLSNPQNEKLDVSIFPNPFVATFDLKLNLKQAQTVKVTILDITGKSIFNTHVFVPSADHISSIDMSAFASGTYFVEIQTNSGSSVKKLIKE